MADDVYAPGSGEVIADPDPAAAIVQALRQTWPWTAFLSVIGLLTTGFLFFGGAALLALGNSVGMPAGSDPFNIGRWIGVLYLGFGFVSLVPFVLITRFTIAAFRVSDDDGLASAARATRRSRDLWIGYGILTIVVMIAYCGGIAAVVAAAMAGAST